MRGTRAVPAALLGVLCVLGAVLALPAQAATRTVTLTSTGPVPATLTLARGDRVRFVNGEQLAQHRVTSQAGWHFDSGTLGPGTASGLTPVLAAGTYRYTDTRTLVTSSTFTGALVVPAPRPTPTPSRSASPRPSPSPSASVAPTTSPRPSTPPASGTPSPSTSPPAVVVPTPSAVVTPSPSPTASPAPDVRYGDQRALVQGSPHRYGLPVLLGLVGIGGVASLLVRLLLSMAPATRRTGADGD